MKKIIKQIIKTFLFALWLLLMIGLLARKPLMNKLDEIGPGGCFPELEIETVEDWR